MTRSADRRFTRLAMIAVLAATLGLAGCGRKGPLDPPPGASLAEPAEAAPHASSSAAAINPMAAPAKSTTPDAFGPNGEPIAPKGPKKSLFLDWFID